MRDTNWAAAALRGKRKTLRTPPRTRFRRKARKAVSGELRPAGDGEPGGLPEPADPNEPDPTEGPEKDELARVIREILETTGGEFACINRGGNWAVSRVLREAFRKLAGDSVTWDEAHRCWRKAVPPAEEPRS